MSRRPLLPQLRARGVTAVLGPTNTGKTHLAIERMLGHESGMIGLPLRLLAREVYGRVVEKAGVHNVALVTGEEKIKPDRPRYWISTVEAMPRDLDLAFVAVDEIQLAADLDRGHVFTDRLLNQRGREETLLIGSATVRTLITLLFAKDSYTGEHSQKVALMSEGLALHCGMSEEEAIFIKLGALLHDVGKIGVPEYVLCKPDFLTDDEMALMRRHVHHGEQALAGVPRMKEVRAMVLHHHEWWNGGGYPAGLCGEEIPLGARVIAVVDAYDAMTSDRPYRTRLPHTVAVERLRQAAGTQFDPILVGKLFEYLDQLGDAEPLEAATILDWEFLEEFCPSA